MTTHRVDKGTVAYPLMAGDPLRLDVVARTTSAQVGSLSVPVDLTGVQDIAYALYNMFGDSTAATPAFVLGLGDGITVGSAAGGVFSVEMSGSHTALWQGRDWHTAKMTDPVGK